jgi:hypothetical protein
MAIIGPMSDEKPKPVDDLKQGLGLLFRAAKGVVEKIPTEKIEGAVKDGAKEVGKAVEAVANEIDKVFVKATTGSQPPQEGAQPPEPTTAEGVAQAKAQHDEDEKKKQEQAFDDAYAPEPPKGPRVG